MNSKIINTDDLIKLDERLATIDRVIKDGLIYKSLIKGAKKLQEATKTSLLTKMGGAAQRPIKGKYKSYKPLIEGIRMKGNKMYSEVNVNILGHGFLRWFEKGTDIRKTSKGANRGRIEGLNFFLMARQQSIGQVESIIIQNIEKNLNKII